MADEKKEMKWCLILESKDIPKVIIVLILSIVIGVIIKNELLVLGCSALATIIMAMFIACQTKATRESVEEIKKQRLTNIVVKAIGTLNKIKQKIEANFKHIEKGEYDELESIKEELEIPELVVANKLLNMPLISELEYYQWTLNELKKENKRFKEILCKDDEISKGIVNRVLNAIKNDPETKDILKGYENLKPCEHAYILLTTFWQYENYGIMVVSEDGTIKLDFDKVYQRVKEALDECSSAYGLNNEVTTTIWVILYNIKSYAKELMFSQDEEDRKAKISRDRRIKLIDEAIKRLEEKYIKT